MSSEITPHVYINSKGKKTFVPLENNPAVFSDLIHRLGISNELGFYDIYSIDDPDLLAFVPRPAHAVIFIAPADAYYRRREKDTGSKVLTYSGSGDAEPVMWFKQTIGHSCGLMALLHSVSNGSAKQYIKPNSLLDKLLKEALPLKPLDRAAVLYNSQPLEEAHMASAVKGDSKPPMAEEPNGYHFLAFVKGKNGHLYEMDGSWDGPIDRGLLGEDDDMLSEKAVEMGIRKFVDESQDNPEFSMVALATSPERSTD